MPRFSGQLVSVPPQAQSEALFPNAPLYPAGFPGKGAGRPRFRGETAPPAGRAGGLWRGALGARGVPVLVLPSLGTPAWSPRRHCRASSTRESQGSLWPPRANVPEQTGWTRREVKIVLVYRPRVPLTTRVKFTDCNHKMRSIPGFIGLCQLYALC